LDSDPDPKFFLGFVTALVLHGLTWKTVLAFIDDILVIGKTFEQHLCNLAEAFDLVSVAWAETKA